MMTAWFEWFKFWRRWRKPQTAERVSGAEFVASVIQTALNTPLPPTPKPAKTNGGREPEQTPALVATKPEPQPEPEQDWGTAPLTSGEEVQERERRKHKPHKPHDFTYHYLRQDLAERVDMILSRFEHLPQAHWDYRDDDMRNLEDLWGCDFLLLDPELGKRMKGADKWSAIDDASTGEMIDVVWPIDYAFAQYNEKKDGVVLWRVISKTPKDVRGEGLRQVYPKMFRVIMGKFTHKKWEASDFYLGLVGKELVVLAAGNRAEGLSVSLRRHMAKHIGNYLSSILTARYEWHVALGVIKGGPRLLFPTNPSDCLQLFRNRDLAPGESRRNKLRHWVEEHYRENDEGLAFVCSHLRGHTLFNWSDMQCELFVSQYDLEKNELFKKQAAEWRSRRQHNRVRVHIKRGPK